MNKIKEKDMSNEIHCLELQISLIAFKYILFRKKKNLYENNDQLSFNKLTIIVLYN